MPEKKLLREQESAKAYLVELFEAGQALLRGPDGGYPVDAVCYPYVMPSRSCILSAFFLIIMSMVICAHH